MTGIKIHLGQRVREMREKKGWSQNDLAARLPGVRQQSIDQLERGHVKRPRFLPELADALGAPLQWLLTGEGIRTAPRGRKADMLDAGLMRDVLAAVDQVLAQRGRKVNARDKAKLVCALYELMQGEDARNAQMLEQVASNIISYDKFLRRTRS